MVVDIDLLPFLFAHVVCYLDDGDVSLDVDFVFGCLSSGVGCLSFLSISLEDLVVLKFLL